MSERGHIESATHRYGCHNKPRPTAASSYIAQSEWEKTVPGDKYGNPTRQPLYRNVHSAFGTTACQYDRSQHQKGALA